MPSAPIPPHFGHPLACPPRSGLSSSSSRQPAALSALSRNLGRCIRFLNFYSTNIVDRFYTIPRTQRIFRRFSTYTSGRMPNAQEKFVVVPAPRQTLPPQDAGFFQLARRLSDFRATRARRPSGRVLGVRKARKSENNDASWKKDKSYFVMMICCVVPSHSTIAPNISATYRTGT